MVRSHPSGTRPPTTKTHDQSAVPDGATGQHVHGRGPKLNLPPDTTTSREQKAVESSMVDVNGKKEEDKEDDQDFQHQHRDPAS